MLEERLRIKDGDVLAQWQTELCRRAVSLSLADADAREAYFAECRQLFAAIPDRGQRMAWQVQVVLALSIATPGMPGEMLMAKVQP